MLLERILLCSIVLCLACGTALDLVPSGPQPEFVKQEPVPFPPPPARADLLPPKPSARCLWLDGYYAFEDDRWVWHKGRWVNPRAQCYFAAPTWSYEGLGEAARLHYRGAGFYRIENDSVVACPPPPDCSPL